ncbi:lipid A deacylase LpxR family protein [Geovibrio thiophilus]|uniref:Lipid A deacylase LpxR family protein n=1 Tax=Geovibrio thiophilus TaxID=139438 RepID=A0A3R6AYU2_9BACT|nr:lipid A deacylase LpxR family protein [Geovibrio thiophilus]QAR33691.1 lipid A deacylase LpxR family protein [Geovibrio thiophilus]
MLTLLPAAPQKAFAAGDGLNGTLSLVIENDIFYSDQYYTNGVRASWTTAADKKPDWALNAARLFPFFPDNSSVRTNYAIGQNMYTPKETDSKNPPSDDHPYAGWLYGSVGLIAENGRQLDQIELTLGIVGSVSLAEQTQKFVHKVRGIDIPQGWDTQLKNEPGIVLTYQRSWRSYVSKSFIGVPFDLTPHAGGALGNVFTYANTGITLRYGKGLPVDYGPPRIQPSLPGSGFFVSQKDFSWYLFAGVEGRYIARNIFLDGNSFTDSRSVDKEPFVGDLQMGVVVTKGNVRLGYTKVLRTREFKSQSSDRQDFGAFSLSMQF